ncbi:MAG TPA: 6-phosphofructokinase [Bacillota bacterium]|nr:6-phosphofructokinase [Bacillota bacterium]
MSDIKRIGVLTGGGDCPGLNAVIRAVAKTSIHEFGWEVLGIEDGFGGLIEGRLRLLKSQDVSGILPRGGTILGTTNRDNPFRYPVIEQGQKIYKDMSPLIINTLADHGVQALVVIGGDGSLSIAREFHQKGLPVVGIPNSIDNDLSATDVTFGFDTALVTATEALDKLHTTAESHHRVMVMEVMGRYAGWIGLESGIAGGADVILIPEIPFSYDKICEKLNSRREQGKKFSIIVVSEGAKPVGGDMVVNQVIADSADPIRLGGVGNMVAREIEKLSGMETRVTVLGHLQRGGSPTPFDRILGTRLGVKAVELIASGEYGTMASLRTPDIVAVTLDEAVGELRRVPINSDLIAAARAVGTSFGD